MCFVFSSFQKQLFICDFQGDFEWNKCQKCSDRCKGFGKLFEKISNFFCCSLHRICWHYSHKIVSIAIYFPHSSLHSKCSILYWWAIVSSCRCWCECLHWKKTTNLCVFISNPFTEIRFWTVHNSFRHCRHRQRPIKTKQQLQCVGLWECGIRVDDSVCVEHFRHVPMPQNDTMFKIDAEGKEPNRKKKCRKLNVSK